jgi:hypothetical protein
VLKGLRFRGVIQLAFMGVEVVHNAVNKHEILPNVGYIPLFYSLPPTKLLIQALHHIDTVHKPIDLLTMVVPFPRFHSQKLKGKLGMPVPRPDIARVDGKGKL